MRLESFVMYCSSCGKELVEDANFCMYCGRKVPSDTEVTKLELPPVPPIPPVTPTLQKIQLKNEEKRDIKKQEKKVALKTDLPKSPQQVTNEKC